MFRRLLFPAAAVVLMLACASEAPKRQGSPWLTDRDFVVAGLPDDADSSEVLAQLGEPDSVISTPDPEEPDIDLLAWVYPELAVAFGEDGLRYGITLTGPGVATARGLRTGDSTDRLTELYGRPQRRDAAGWDYVAPDDADGLHVMRVRLESGRVSWIFLGWLLE
ncbi:MAG TPA: hypothetical protein VFV65_00830 [Gemmatimonadales bacterium]|nr:hypothetical protein [Gemmatimonadales bacterium]